MSRGRGVQGEKSETDLSTDPHHRAKSRKSCEASTTCGVPAPWPSETGKAAALEEAPSEDDRGSSRTESQLREHQLVVCLLCLCVFVCVTRELAQAARAQMALDPPPTSESRPPCGSELVRHCAKFAHGVSKTPPLRRWWNILEYSKLHPPPPNRGQKKLAI